jgi:hypothetical protein
MYIAECSEARNALQCSQDNLFCKSGTPIPGELTLAEAMIESPFHDRWSYWVLKCAENFYSEFYKPSYYIPMGEPGGSLVADGQLLFCTLAIGCELFVHSQDNYSYLHGNVKLMCKLFSYSHSLS